DGLAGDLDRFALGVAGFEDDLHAIVAEAVGGIVPAGLRAEDDGADGEDGNGLAGDASIDLAADDAHFVFEGGRVAPLATELLARFAQALLGRGQGGLDLVAALAAAQGQTQGGAEKQGQRPAHGCGSLPPPEAVTRWQDGWGSGWPAGVPARDRPDRT